MSQTRLTTTALPDDIMVDILSRLSVNNLARFRCVSKLWNSLFNDDVFIKLHFARKEAGTNNARFRVLASLTPVARVIMCERFDDGYLYDMIAAIETRQMFGLATVGVMGSCDGLLCIRMTERDTKFAVWNPSTRVSKVISIGDVSGEERPGSSFMFRAQAEHWLHLGFGYDCVTDDYKIVRFEKYPIFTKVQTVEILTVGTLQWRRVEFKLKGEFMGSQGSFFRGALHWINLVRSKKEGQPEYRMRIASFNLSTEEFETDRIQLPIPDGVKDDHEMFKMIRYLMVFDEELWLLNAEKKGSPMEIWSYGADCLWTKKLVLCPPVGKEWVFPLYFMRDGLVLVAVEKYELMYYDPEKKSYLRARLRGRSGYNVDLGSNWTWKVSAFFHESLVSPYRIPKPAPSSRDQKSKNYLL